MNLAGISIKNATVKWWRSLTLGFFIFSVSFVMVISGSFITTIKSRVDKVIMNGITGSIEIRSNQSREGDMVAQYSQGWDSLRPLSASTVAGINQILDSSFSEVEHFNLTRQNAFLTGNGKREEAMLIGIDENFTSYKDAFLLIRGRYLDPSASDEILLTEEQAGTFNVDLGDRITITTKNIYGLNSTADLKVVGIGNYIMLSLFSYKANYTNNSTVRKLIDMKDGAATDIILFAGDNKNVKSYIDSMQLKIKDAGIKYSLTSEEKLKSDDLKIKDLDFDTDDEDEGIKISTYDEMGGTYRGVSDTMFVVLNILVLFLIIIISILIINLIYMSGIERYTEIGTLRAIGFNRQQVIRIFMGEILFVSFLAGFLGILSGCAVILILGSTWITSPIAALDFIMGRTLNLQLDPASTIINLAVIIGFSFAASFYPAYKACSVEPAEALRKL